MKENNFARQMYKNLGISPREVDEKVSKAQFRGNALAKAADARSWSPGVYEDDYMIPEEISYPHEQMQAANEKNLAVNLAPGINNEDVVGHMSNLLGLSKAEVMRRIGIADFDSNPFSRGQVQEFSKGFETIPRYTELQYADGLQKAEDSAPMENARGTRTRDRRARAAKFSDARRVRAKEKVRTSRQAEEVSRNLSPRPEGSSDFDSPDNDHARELPLGMYEHQGRVREYGGGQLREHDEAANPEDGITSFLVHDYNRAKNTARPSAEPIRSYAAEEDFDGSPF